MMDGRWLVILLVMSGGLMACEGGITPEQGARRDEAIAELLQRAEALEATNLALREELDVSEERLAALEALTQGLEREEGDFVFVGGNVQILNGEGETASTNGKGNLIIGYNEEGSNNDYERTGSHNLVLGQGNDYTSYYGIVSGAANSIAAKGAVILSGLRNSVIGAWSVIGSGNDNYISVERSVIITGSGEDLSGALKHQMVPTAQ